MAPMKRVLKGGALPPIVVTVADEARLTALAMAAQERVPDVAEHLLGEMDRAEVVTGGLPDGVVGMGSLVEFVDDGGKQRRVTLVYPAEADIAQERISVLTPVGAALIGLAVGQSISWSGRDGRPRRLTVLAVEPAGAPADMLAS